MNRFVNWQPAIPTRLVVMVLLSLALVSTGHAANKPKQNNNRAKIEQMRRQMAMQAVAQARMLAKQIQVMDTRIKVARQELSYNREYMERAAPPMQLARSKNEASKLHLTSAKLDLNEVENNVLGSVVPSSSYLAQKSAVAEARTEYEKVRRSAELKIDPLVKGVEKEKQITAVPAVQQAQRTLKRAVDVAEQDKRTILRASRSWTGARDRLRDSNTAAEGTQRALNQKVSVYNKYRIGANKAQRELNGCLKTKQVLLAQKQAAENMARQYGYYQRPASRGSRSHRSPGGKGR